MFEDSDTPSRAFYVSMFHFHAICVLLLFGRRKTAQMVDGGTWCVGWQGRTVSLASSANPQTSSLIVVQDTKSYF